MDRILVIVPCGIAKVWDRKPATGPTPAYEAYTGSLFRMNRRYAERFGDTWVILSAKYGFVRPDSAILGPYNVTFKNRSTDPIDVGTLRAQVHTLGLGHHDHIIVLGGREYQVIAEQAFAGTGLTLSFPFSGISPPGRLMQATKRAIEAGIPIPV